MNLNLKKVNGVLEYVNYKQRAPAGELSYSPWEFASCNPISNKPAKLHKSDTGVHVYCVKRIDSEQSLVWKCHVLYIMYYIFNVM